ncbi:MAG: TolC family protein [Candidatus Aminicenantes bacterium]|nr:TolC family protein [Candidatus Aminicenantes bacterium]
MRKRKIRIFVFLTLFIAITSFAQQKEKALSLEDCILKAMENNLDVAIEVLTPELADISISKAQEKFLPSLSLSYSKRDQISASYSFLDASDQVATARDDYSAEISQLIPTGGSFSISLSGRKTDTNRRFTSINPRYENTITFNFTQPLLRNFGFKINRREIIIARNNQDISENQLKRVLQETIYSVEEAYWNLVHSIENLKVRKQSLKLAQDLLEKNKRAVEVGTLAPIEILSAQSAVATREADILQAEALLKDSEDRLKTIINLAATEKEAELATIIPLDKPAYEKKEVSLDEALLTAMENRPDLNATRIDLKNKDLDLSYSRNQLLPNLSLNASYWSPGITGDQLLYPPGDPFADPIGVIKGSPSDALRDALDFKYDNWSAAITLDIPLNTILSRADYAQARVNLDQAMLKLKNQEQQIFLEIKNAVRAVQTDYKRVQAYKVARELAEKTLEAEEEKLKVGITTPFFVLQYQTDLATAQTNELKAMVDYNLSLARLDRAMGVSLKVKNIKFSAILGE